MVSVFFFGLLNEWYGGHTCSSNSCK
jgi:hypothetical protein